jgi:hypothetical protein
VRDQRGIAFAAAADHALKLDPWLACPLHVETAPEPVLWELARQFDVAGPLILATKNRADQERLIKNAPRLQGKKGTPWAVEEVMRILGFTEAQVTDRVGLLKYNGAATHDGEYCFDSGFTGWRDYRIRLFVGPNSRPFDEQGQIDASRLAALWAPLRSNLEAFYARHIITTKTKDPIQVAESVSRVIVSNKKGNGQFVTFWLQYFQNQNKCAIHWRHPLAYIGDASRLVLQAPNANGGNTTLYETAMPTIQNAPNLTYEGVWTFEE